MVFESMEDIVDMGDDIVDNMAMVDSKDRVTMPEIMDHFGLESNRYNGIEMATIAPNLPQLAPIDPDSSKLALMYLIHPD